MKKVFFVSLTMFILLVAQSFGQKETTEFRLSLRDGNVITGSTQINNVNLATLWGKLDIPTKNISQVLFGISPDKTQKENIKSLIIDLNNSTENIRKKAYEALTSLSMNCIPVIEDVINSESYIPPTSEDYTAEMALNELKSKYNYDEASVGDDVIVTDNGYRIGGTFNLKSVSLKTEYGNLEVPREKIKSIDVFYKGGDMTEATFTLLANKHISGNTNGGWFKTSIYVRSGQKIKITASGEVTLASLSGYKYKPDGKYSGANYDYDVETDYTSPSSSTYPTYGNVVFKVGESGTMIKAGALYNGTISGNGYIYLSIYETVYNASNTGSYLVRIKLN